MGHRGDQSPPNGNRSPFGLLHSLQSDNVPSFTSQVTQQVFKDLQGQYPLHIAQRPQASGRVKRAAQILIKTSAKLCQGASKPWLDLLLITLVRLRANPQSSLRLRVFELLYGRPYKRTYF